MAGVGTLTWSKQYAGMKLTEVRAAKVEIQRYIDSAVDKNRDGFIDDTELRATLRGESRAIWSAVMGTYASADGSAHGGPLTRTALTATLNSGMDEINKANSTKPRTLEVVELRTLKHRMPGRIIEFSDSRK